MDLPSLIAGLALVVVGLAGVFLGYRLFRLLLPVYGAVFGFVAAWGWLGESAWLVALIIGVLLGVILGALAYTIWSAYVAVVGAVFGLALGSLISTSLNLWTWLAVIVTLVLAVGFGLLFLRVRNEMVIVATALAGAAAIARGIGEWFGLNGGLDAAKAQTSTGLIILMGVTFLFFAVIGIWFQWGRYHELTAVAKAGKTTPQAATPPAPAARAAVVDTTAAGGAAAAPIAAGAAGVAAVAVAATKAEAAAPPVAAAELQATAEETAEVVEAAPEVVAAEEAFEAAPEVPAAEEAGEVTVAAAEEVTAEVLEASPAAPDVISPEVLAVELGPAEAAAVALAASIDNKAEETPLAETAEQSAESLDEAAGVVGDNLVETAIKEIEETFPLEDIAKFKEKLEYVEGIGAVYAEKLRAVGVHTVLDLLRRGATRRGRLELVEVTGISDKLILRWINHADLYRIKGVGSEYADLLEAAGVDTVVELGKRNPANLLNAMLETNKVKSLVRQEPAASQVADWVTQAKKLPRVIQY